MTRIVQITDTHIVPKNKMWLNTEKTQTAERLLAVITRINELDPQPDMVVHTGDLTNDGSTESTQYGKEILDRLNAPYCIIPGNHDDREALRTIFSDTSWMPSEGYLHYFIPLNNVQIIALDSKKDQASSGELCSTRLTWLAQTLETSPHKPTCLMMHHSPHSTGVHPIDKISCTLPVRFWELLKEYPHIRIILAGHYHHSCTNIQSDGLYSFIAPSVAARHAYQEPNREKNIRKIELTPPHFTLHDWDHNNQIFRTHIRDVWEHSMHPYNPHL